MQMGHAGLCFAALIAAGCATTATSALAERPRRPNVVVVLADDLGWSDLAVYGGGLTETPHLDRLAARGARLTHAYAAAPICSPSRAALLTGRSPARLHLTDWIAGHRPPPDARLQVPAWTKTLPASETTLPEALRAAGYVSALIGKWHLGPDDPRAHGFDVAVAGTDKGQPPSYFAPYRIPGFPDGPRGEYLTDRLTTEAERFVTANRDRPFFLLLTHFAPHTPLQAPEPLVAKYREKIAGTRPHESGARNPVYAAMVEAIDASVGRLVARLEQLGLAERTLFVFTSDNGGLARVTSNAPLRDGKGTAYEGAVRVPFIATWPGVIAPHASAEPVITADLFPTVLAAAGVAPAAAIPLDGEDLLPLLRGRGRLTRTALYWHYPHYHSAGGRPFSAVRKGRHRLVEHLEDGRLELFDLERDQGETRDLSAAEPGVAAALRADLTAWRTRVNAQMPAPRPTPGTSSLRSPPVRDADRQREKNHDAAPKHHGHLPVSGALVRGGPHVARRQHGPAAAGRAAYDTAPRRAPSTAGP